MEQFFRTKGGRLFLVLGGVDLALMGIAGLVEDPALTDLLAAWVPPLSIAFAIYGVALSMIERGGLLPIGIVSAAILLGGIYVFGLSNATFAGAAAGTVLLSVGVIAVLLGLRPTQMIVEPMRQRAIT